jgi:hypothetical protein
VLKEAFSILFGIARMEDASVEDNMEVLGDSIQWNVSFVREAHDWEVGVFASFHVLHSAMVSRDRADRLRWVPSKKGVFKVKSYFSSLAGCEGSRFPWKSVWWTQAPSRAAFFAWSATLGKILTVDNLRKRKIIIVDRCYLCERDGETVDHLLLHFDVASTLWNHVFSRFGMSWVMPRRVVDLFACWWKAGRSRSAAVWKMVPICILWCVWKERNLRCFEDLESSMENIVASFFRMLYFWTVAFLSPLSISFSDFLVRFSMPS